MALRRGTNENAIPLLSTWMSRRIRWAGRYLRNVDRFQRL
jgi:hypothetical protein